MLQKWTSSCCLRSLLSCCTLKMCANWPPAYHTSVGGAYKSWNYCRQVLTSSVAVDAVGFAALFWSEKGIPLCLTFLSGMSFFSFFLFFTVVLTKFIFESLQAGNTWLSEKNKHIFFTNLSIFSLVFFKIYIKTSMMAWKSTFSTKMWQYHVNNFIYISLTVFFLHTYKTNVIIMFTLT